MNEQDFISGRKLEQKFVSRRNLIRGAAGTAAGAGFLLGSGLRMPALAQEAAQETCRDLPRPIPHISSPPGQHFFFAGPVNADPVASPNTGHDPSTITNFQGMIAQADLFFTGTGTKLDTGESATYGFHTDWRFMTGVFIGVDGLQHNGTVSFI
jgi:hypothetical protein